MATPLIENVPSPVPVPAVIAVERLAVARVALVFTVPSRPELAVVPVPLLPSFRARRKFVVSLAAPSITSPAELVSVTLSVVWL